MNEAEAVAIVRAAHPRACVVPNGEAGMTEIWLDVLRPTGMRYGTNQGAAETWIRLAGYIQQGAFNDR